MCVNKYHCGGRTWIERSLGAYLQKSSAYAKDSPAGSFPVGIWDWLRDAVAAGSGSARHRWKDCRQHQQSRT